MINYYEVLQIHQKADRAVIRAAYRTLMKELGNHPDHGGSHTRARLINEAYEHLIDPQRRKMVDQRIRTGSWTQHGQAKSATIALVRCKQCNTLNRIQIELLDSVCTIQCGRCRSRLPYPAQATDMPYNDYHVNKLVENLKKNKWTVTDKTDENFDVIIRNNFFMKNFIYIKKIGLLSPSNVKELANMCTPMCSKQLTPVGHYFILIADKISYMSYVIDELKEYMKYKNGWNSAVILPVDLSRRQIFLSHVNLNHHPADILQLRSYIFN